NTANNSASTSAQTGWHSTPANLLPANNVNGVATSGPLYWNVAGAASYTIYLGKKGSGCTTLLGTSIAPMITYSGLQPGTDYEWRVQASTPSCPPLTRACVTFTTTPSC